MIAYPVHVEDAMLIVPVNLPSLPVPAVPPQTASSSPSTTGNTRRDRPNGRFNMSLLPPKLGRIQHGGSGGALPAGERPMLPNTGLKRRGRCAKRTLTWSVGLLTCRSAVRAKVSGRMSDEVARHLTGIIESMSGFLAAMMDPEMGRHAADPAASNFIAGNPQELAMPQYVRTLQRWAEPKDKDWFGYKMPHRAALAAAAEGLSKELGLSFGADDIVLTRGAHGGLAAALTVVVDPGDEVIFISPPWFFYEALILGARGKPVKVRVKPGGFDLDVDAIAAAISPRTRAVLINTPHNPTGRIFGKDTLRALGSVLEEGSARNGRPIYLISD